MSIIAIRQCIFYSAQFTVDSVQARSRWDVEGWRLETKKGCRGLETKIILQHQVTSLAAPQVAGTVSTAGSVGPYYSNNAGTGQHRTVRISKIVTVLCVQNKFRKQLKH